MTNTNARAAYVRTEMLPEQSPPSTVAGPVKWLRENLFSSIPNAVMTFVALYVVYYVLSHTLGWMVYGIWDAGSLSECREIRNGHIANGDWAEGTSVACWAVLTDRWHQLLFGFYPPEYYWRPIAALLLFGGALAPILFDSLPRKMLIVTLMAPFICFWLLWGGTIWGPLVVASGFAIGFAFIKYGW